MKGRSYHLCLRVGCGLWEVGGSHFFLSSPLEKVYGTFHIVCILTDMVKPYEARLSTYGKYDIQGRLPNRWQMADQMADITKRAPCSILSL